MAKISLGVCLIFLVVSSTIYEVQGTFLLRLYMRKCPFRRRAFRPFACSGMLKFCDLLQHRCPLTPHYSNFFSKMKSFMSFIQSSSGSSNFDAELKTQAQGLQSAMSQMSGGSSGSADSSKVINAMMSMGKTLGETEKSGSVLMSRSQRRELIFSMITWARTIAQFVVSSSASSKGGASIDMSSLGVDDDGSSPKSGGTSGGSFGAKGSVNTGSNSSSTGSTTGSSGGSIGFKGSANTGSNSGFTGSTTGSTGSSTGSSGSSCNTCGGNTNGGSSFKGSMNFQQQAQAQAQGGSQNSQGSSMNNAH